MVAQEIALPQTEVRWDVVTGPPDVLAVTASGEIDLMTASLLRRAVVEAFDHSPATAMVIDLSAVGLLSSAGITVLAHAHEIAAERSVALALVLRADSVPGRLLTMLGLDELWVVYPSRAVASQRTTDEPRPDSESERDTVVSVLVNQALDDLEAARLDIAEALRQVACISWDIAGTVAPPGARPDTFATT